MPIRRSQDATRPEAPRARVGNDEHRTGIEGSPPAPPPLKEDKRDPVSGRFVEGNAAAKLSHVRRAAKPLDPDRVKPWLRPFAQLAHVHARHIIAELPVQTTALNALAIDTASALAIGRALMSAGGEHGNVKVLREARAWLREHRQNLITLMALARDEAAARRGAPAQAVDWAALRAELPPAHEDES